MADTQKYRLATAAERSAGIVLLLVVVEFLDQLLGAGLDRFGIIPWTEAGLVGILFAPVLHGGFGHLAANVGPLFILLLILFWNRKYYPERTVILIWLLSGIGTWVIGRRMAVHIGASSIVFGLVSYLIVAAIWMACWRALFFSILVFVLFGGLFYGLFQIEQGVSWEGHLSGAIAGFWVAWINHKR
jgi:membrane associated rhomboid family serine protease